MNIKALEDVEVIDQKVVSEGGGDPKEAINMYPETPSMTFLGNMRTWTFGEDVPNHIPQIIGPCGYSHSTRSIQEFVELISQCPLELEQEYGKFFHDTIGKKRFLSFFSFQ